MITYTMWVYAKRVGIFYAILLAFILVVKTRPFPWTRITSEFHHAFEPVIRQAIESYCDISPQLQ